MNPNKNRVVNSGVLEGYAIPAKLVAPGVKYEIGNLQLK